ncbi:MAG TPA: SPOR domain-containing protein, partial [Beijerinckiaceae bacterium]
TTGAAPAGLPTGGPAANGFFPEPRKVRTVSVRPDGTIINPPAPPRPAAAPAAAAPAPAPAVRQITAPPAPAQAAPAGAQSNAIPRPPGSIPSVAPAAPVVAAAPKVTARATPVVSAPVAAIEDEAPARARVAAVAPTAPAASAPRAASAGGDYEVQLAAPGSEREARAAIASARQRHGAALGAQQPTIRKATVGGREIYRVRVVGLSQEEANGLCSKLKASGGACFVARN